MATTQESLRIYLPAEMAAEVKARTEAEGRTVTGLIRMLLRQYLTESDAKST